MRKLLPILFIFCLTANITFAAPNYDPDKKWVNYDDSYNVALWNRLNKQYHDKHFLYEEIDSEGNVRDANGVRIGSAEGMDKEQAAYMFFFK